MSRYSKTVVLEFELFHLTFQSKGICYAQRLSHTKQYTFLAYFKSFTQMLTAY